MTLSKMDFVGSKCVMRVDRDVCQTADDLLSSVFFASAVGKFVRKLRGPKSVLLDVFPDRKGDGENFSRLIKIFQSLNGSAISEVRSKFDWAEPFLQDASLLNDFVEELYRYWRHFERFLVYQRKSEDGGSREKRPRIIFGETVERLSQVILSAYRNIQENITGQECRVYRQVSAGAQVGVIAMRKDWPCPGGIYQGLKDVPIICQLLLNPPLVLNPLMNKRDGSFLRVDTNPLERLTLESEKWLCYPAKVGNLLIHIFFNNVFLDLGCSLANLFELAGDEDLDKRPDAVFVFGVPGDVLYRYGPHPIVFFDDEPEGILVAAVPDDPSFGYFGYLKKMVLTLHNVIVMKRGDFPYHGAMVNVLLNEGVSATVLLIGDTGAGKSETLEELLTSGKKYIREMTIIADDMGSVVIGEGGELFGYGTETGAFVRLDDLPRSYAFGNIDRAIIMSAEATNARAIIPLTTMSKVLKGYKIDFILYANNHEAVDRKFPVIEAFPSVEKALEVFREGKVMAKGTTTSKGLTKSYFANPFGPPQYQELHDRLAEKVFSAAFDRGLFVGQLRTQLGLPGWAIKGPEESAQALLSLISAQKKNENG